MVSPRGPSRKRGSPPVGGQVVSKKSRSLSKIVQKPSESLNNISKSAQSASKLTKSIIASPSSSIINGKKRSPTIQHLETNISNVSSPFNGARLVRASTRKAQRNLKSLETLEVRKRVFNTNDEKCISPLHSELSKQPPQSPSNASTNAPRDQNLNTSGEQKESEQSNAVNSSSSSGYSTSSDERCTRLVGKSKESNLKFQIDDEDGSTVPRKKRRKMEVEETPNESGRASPVYRKNVKEKRKISTTSNEEGETNAELYSDASKLPNEVERGSAEEDASSKASPVESILQSPSNKNVPIAPTASLFRRLPPGLPRQPPVVVLDAWHHGQLVWWNRFLANRKRTQGTSIGNYVGRVVDLDSEWFPNAQELPQTKTRLRNLAAAMGRRSIFVQGLDEMRYLTLPPRAVSSFPDPDPERHKELLVGLKRAGGPVARKGLRIALMVEELRAAIGAEMNSLLEIEFLDICIRPESKQFATTEAELERFENLSVWDVLRHQSLDVILTEKELSLREKNLILPSSKLEILSDGQTESSPKDLPHSFNENGAVYVAPISNSRSSIPPPLPDEDDHKSLSSSLIISKSSIEQYNVESKNGGLLSGRSFFEPSSSTVRKSRTSGRGRSINVPRTEAPPTSRRGRRPAAERLMKTAGLLDGSALVRRTKHEPVLACAQYTLEHCKAVCKNLCLRCSELLFLLRGVPATLLASSTGLCLPEEIPSYSLKTLELLHTITPRSDGTPTGTNAASCRLLGLHLSIANAFLHKLCRTMVLRVPIKTSEKDVLDKRKEESGLGHEQKQLILSDDIEINENNEATKSDTQPKRKQGGAVQYSLVFSLDHIHQPISNLSMQDEKKQIPQSADSWLYTMSKPFSCVGYSHVLWKPLLINMVSPMQDTTHSRGSSNCSVASGKLFLTETLSLSSANRRHGKREFEKTDVIIENRPSFFSSMKCHKASLRVLACGARHNADNSDGVGHYCVNLNQISENEPNSEELETVATRIVNNSFGKITLRELERRLEELNCLKEVGAYMKSIYDDIGVALKQMNGVIPPEDARYFESLWLDVQRKLK